MRSYSEIECAFVMSELSIENYLLACNFIQSLGFRLNKKSPGCFFCEDFYYRDWCDLEQAYECVKKEKYKYFCINFSPDECGFYYPYGFSLEFELEYNCISLKICEEVFVDKLACRIDRNKFLNFVSLNEKLASLLNVKFWKIAQTGFDYDNVCGSDAIFFDYDVRLGYPRNDIEKIIDWYDDQYLSRW